MSLFRGRGVRKDATRGTLPGEERKAAAGLFVPSSVFGARQGILPAPGDPLKVTGTAGWQYSVNAGHVVTSRSDLDGAILFGNDGTALTDAVSAAPASGARYDLIYVRHQNIDAGGGETSDATLGVVSGDASGTPTKPALPAGAVTIAEALVSAGATSTNHANVTITNPLGSTVARGGILPVANQAERDALAKYPGLAVYRIDTGAVEFCDGTSWGVGGPEIRSGSKSGTTSAGGDIAVTFATPFAANPTSVVVQDTNIGGGIGAIPWKVHTVTATGFIARAMNGSTPIAGLVTTFNYIAVRN